MKSVEIISLCRPTAAVTIRLPLLVLLVLLGWMGPISRACAHSGAKLGVAQLDPGSPRPVIDGIFNETEYSKSALYSILYRPRIDFDPAIIRAVADDTNLYLCVANLVYGPYGPSFISITLDTFHNGGTTPDGNDLRFRIDKSGTAAADRGDGSGGFIADPTITGWEAARTRCCGEFFSSWTVEFRIPMSLIRRDDGPFALAFPTVGIHIRQNSVTGTGDDYGWPVGASGNVPNTWGDIKWSVTSSGEDKLQADVFRVTQGLDYDVSGGVAYDLIANKDTLVRAQLFNSGPLRGVSSAVCRFQRLAFPLLSIPPGLLQTVAMEFVPAAKVNSVAYGYFNGTPVANAWIDGTLIDKPGVYHFDLQVSLAGASAPQIVDLGNFNFWPTADQRLLIYPWNFPPEATRYQKWDDAMSAAAYEDLLELQRMWPLRVGVGAIYRTATPPPGAPGLRVSFVAPYDCAAGTKLYDPAAAKADTCESRVRNIANQALDRFNAAIRALNSADGLRRDIYDWAMVLAATTGSTGGQSCWPGQRVSGSEIDTALVGGAASVISQEQAHCLGEVNPASPHSIPGNPRHSSTGIIPLYRAEPMINMRMRGDIVNPLTGMSPVVDLAINTILEGWEWNDLRKNLLASIPSPTASLLATISKDQNSSPSCCAASSGFSQANQSVFLLNGVLYRTNNHLIVDYSARLDAAPMALTPVNANSPYALLFQDNNGNVTGQLPFTVTFQGTHDLHDVVPVYLVAALPGGSTRVEIRNGNALLFGASFSAAPPVVGNVLAIPQADAGVLLQWVAFDPDSPQLNYNIFFLRASNEIPVLLASGLTTNSYLFPADFAPATSEARLIVEASDGYNTAQNVSNPFVIAARPPLPYITSPGPNSIIVAGQPFTLLGGGYDFTDGPLSGAALSWSADNGQPLGAGSHVQARLAAGLHVVTLTATASSVLSSNAQIVLNALADSDGDGLPDTYEAQFPCLSAMLFDSDQDPDGDGLSSLAEFLRGTNPCNADSDNDGISDGDEVRFAGNPNDPQTQPAPDLLFLSSNSVDLGTCPDLSSPMIDVQTLNPQIPWTASSSADWLSLLANGQQTSSRQITGQGNGTFRLIANCQDLPEGNYTATVLAGLSGSQLQSIDVHLAVPPPLRISIERNSLSILLHFPNVPGKSLQLQSTDELNVNAIWTPVGNVLFGSSEELSVAVNTSPNVPKRFYRLRTYFNDDFANRLSLDNVPFPGSTLSVAGLNFSASKEMNEPNHANSLGGKSVWWTWTAPHSGLVTISTVGSDFDTLLAVYTGSSLATLSLVSSDNDSGGQLNSRVRFNAVANTTYQIVVDGAAGAAGHIWLNIIP